jgi:hypothetical protein
MFDKCKKDIDQAVVWLRAQSGSPKILAKVSRNLGDSLHWTPIARHYRCLYPHAAIAFFTESRYSSIHCLNQDYKTFNLPNDLNPQLRIKLGNYMKSLKLDFVLCPAIFPFGEVWDSHKWRLPVISHQYFHNAGIKLSSMLGDRKLHAFANKEDVSFAGSFTGKRPCVAFEYVSYSHTPYWQIKEFCELRGLLSKRGITCISFASSKEPLIPKSLDGRGISWRRTLAILARCKYLVGVGSGITMLAACAKHPKIIEVGVSEAISMCGCGYADSILLSGKSKPSVVADHIKI